MARYAIIQGSTVENVIVADTAPTIPNRTVVQSNTAGPGDTYAGGVFTRRVPSAGELEAGDADSRLPQALPLLRAWANDAQDAAAITGMTAPQRVARQAVIEARVAILSRLCVALIRKAGLND